MSETRETYLGDGLYASFDGWQIVLRAPRSEGHHYVALEPEVVVTLLEFIAGLKDTAAAAALADAPGEENVTDEPNYYDMQGCDMLKALGDNGQLWAQAFIQIIDRIGRDKIDEGFMLGWFANAIEHSNDVRRWAREAAAALADAPGGEAVSGEDRDADWLLGLAQARAQEILRLVQLYEDGHAGRDGTLYYIRAAAQAIVSGPEEEEPEAAEPPGPDE